MPHAMNRRTFLDLAAAGAAAAALPRSARAEDAAGRRVVVGVMGLSRGLAVAKSFAGLPGVEVRYLCDADSKRAANGVEEISKLSAEAPQAIGDFRRILDDPEVDALICAAPNHWHGPATILACQAGKHVYVEKPCSHNITEGRRMVQAARKHNRVVQVGTQSRSSPHMIEAIRYVHSGKLGAVHMARAFNSQLRRRVPAVPDSSAPGTLNWDIWQGPAPERPFNSNRYSYGWRWYWDYGTGDMGNDGVHDLDIARWGLGVETPDSVHGFGTKLFFQGDTQETPDTQSVVFTFPGSPKVLHFDQRLWTPYHMEGYENGVVFYGTEAYLVLGRGGWRVIERGNKLAFEKKASFSEMPHLENFLAACQGKAKATCDILEGHRSTTLAHLGNLSSRLGRPLKFDPATESIPTDPEANALLGRKGRGAFVIPESI